MDSKKKKELELWAAKIRKTALQTIQTAGSGHIGGSFSICDIMSVLYFDKMNVDPANPDQPDRDRLVLSKGHCSPAMYATLALKGFFPVEHLSTFRKLDSDLSGHVEIHVPGVDMSAGSLGQGLSTALGMAMYAKANKTGNRVFCIMGDGEIQEGQIWEAAMWAGHRKLDNLVVIVDNNNLQIDGEITGYNQYNQAVSADGYSSETKLTITVNVRFVNNTNHAEDFEQQFSAFRTYDSSQLLTAVQDGLIAEMSKEITDQIFNATVANW